MPTGVIVERKDGHYIAWSSDGDCVTSGQGDSQREAIGAFVVANREALGISFAFNDHGEILFSNHYGKPRKPSELTACEQEYVKRQEAAK